MIFNKIRPFYFFISLFVGFLLTYVFTPVPDVIYQYPTPENKNQIYMDKANTCFKYKSTKIKCPKDITKISKYPVEKDQQK